MNWFKRYGIVGAYFLCAIVGWYIFLSGLDYKNTFKALIDKFQVGGLVGLATFLFLPAGYLIMVISQWLYYHWGWSLTGRSIHLEIKNKLSDQLKIVVEDYLKKIDFGNKEEEPSSSEKHLFSRFKNFILKIKRGRKDEEVIESVLTYMARQWFNLPSQEQMKSLNEYNQKRFDIIAMNNGIAWATIFAFAIVLLLKLFVLKISLLELIQYMVTDLSRIIVVIITGLLIFIFTYSLRSANRTLEGQILIIERMRFQNLHLLHEDRIRRLAYALSEKKKRPNDGAMQDWLDAQVLIREFEMMS